MRKYNIGPAEAQDECNNCSFIKDEAEGNAYSGALSIRDSASCPTTLMVILGISTLHRSYLRSEIDELDCIEL